MYIMKGLVSGSSIAGFCYCLHFTQIQQIAIKIPCWYISDKNQTKRAKIIKGWFKYMTDCKHFPDHLGVFVPKNGRQQEFEPANSWCDTNPLRK
jgi:hypothetical protein